MSTLMHELKNVDWDSIDATPWLDPQEDEQPSTPKIPAQQSVQPKAFEPDWPAPSPHLLGRERPAAPLLDLQDLLGNQLAEWVKGAAEMKGAPSDYVAAGLLVAAASAIGGARIASPRPQWTEPSILWAAIVGEPSAGKSPALDAVLSPIRNMEKAARARALKEQGEWEETAEIARLAESVWKAKVKEAVASGEALPEKPNEMAIGSQPHIPRYIVNDTTVEKLGLILSKQPKGTLQVRDELSGWLEGMERYSNGAERPFWLEAFGGRSFTVERMAREAVTIERTSVSILGGIQPDRFNSLFAKGDDDGLLARFMPIWPAPVPIAKPSVVVDFSLVENLLGDLYALNMVADTDGEPQPLIIYFTDDAEEAADDLRRWSREGEERASGLIKSFLGKLPGLAVRVSLVLSILDGALLGQEVSEINRAAFDRAQRFVTRYLFPMAKRCYSDASLPDSERRAIRLVNHLRENRISSFSSRKIMRAGISGLRSAGDLNPVLTNLEDNGILRQVNVQTGKQGGRPARMYCVSPFLVSRRSERTMDLYSS